MKYTPILFLLIAGCNDASAKPEPKPHPPMLSKADKAEMRAAIVVANAASANGEEMKRKIDGLVTDTQAPYIAVVKRICAENNIAWDDYQSKKVTIDLDTGDITDAKKPEPPVPASPPKTPPPPAKPPTK